MLLIIDRRRYRFSIAKTWDERFFLHFFLWVVDRIGQSFVFSLRPLRRNSLPTRYPRSLREYCRDWRHFGSARRWTLNRLDQVLDPARLFISSYWHSFHLSKEKALDPDASLGLSFWRPWMDREHKKRFPTFLGVKDERATTWLCRRWCIWRTIGAAISIRWQTCHMRVNNGSRHYSNDIERYRRLPNWSGQERLGL